MEVPADLYQVRPAPPFQGSTNVDLLRWGFLLRSSLNQCHVDKREIQDYVERPEEEK